MPGAFLDDGGETALLDAVRTIEVASSAEVVVAVRRRSARWLHAPILVGVGVAFAGLAFMLFSAHPFSLPSILIDPFIVGAIAGAAASQIWPLIRALTPRRLRRDAVHRAALVTFHDHGVTRTAGRTGLLIYVSLLERMAEIVPDTAVLDAVPADERAATARAIDAAVSSGGRATATAIAALAPVLARALPRAADDRNELPDELRVDRPAPRPGRSPR